MNYRELWAFLTVWSSNDEETVDQIVEILLGTLKLHSRVSDIVLYYYVLRNTM